MGWGVAAATTVAEVVSKGLSEEVPLGQRPRWGGERGGAEGTPRVRL